MFFSAITDRTDRPTLIGLDASMITNAISGAHTTGCLIVIMRVDARVASRETAVLGTAGFSPRVACSFSFNERRRMVTGTTVTLIIRLAIPIGTALAVPNKSPNTAGPIKGTAGAEAPRAVKA